MAKLSKHYRNDPLDGLDPKISAYLDENYLPTLKNLDVPNPKLLVLFSGGNAVGKSTLAQKIQERFHGVVIENDGIKRTVLQFMPAMQRDQLNPITWQYVMALFAKLSEITPNGLIVRDAVIDWYYDRILPLFEQQGYELFIIAYDLSEEKLIELIDKRGDTPTVTAERLHAILDDHALHQKRFRADYTPDLTLTDETVFDHDQVLNALEIKLAQLREQ